MHPQAVAAEIDSLSLTTFAGYFLKYCKTIVQKHGVNSFIMSHTLRYELKVVFVFLLAFLYR